MINQANRRPGHAAYPSTIRSKPFAPVFTCAKRAQELLIALLYLIIRSTASDGYGDVKRFDAADGAAIESHHFPYRVKGLAYRPGE
jgi:hypothetical protein